MYKNMSFKIAIYGKKGMTIGKNITTFGYRRCFGRTRNHFHTHIRSQNDMKTFNGISN